MAHITPENDDSLIDNAGELIHHLDASAVHAALESGQTDAAAAIRGVLASQGLTATHQAILDAAERFDGSAIEEAAA